MHNYWPRNLSLLRWTPADEWTLDQASLGTLITGATGSGKSTGPFQYIIRSFLRAQFGGIFFVAKADAANEYLQLAASEGREKDVILFRPNTPGQGFNFLTYEAKQAGAGKAIVENIVSLLMQAVEITSRKYGQHGDAFFEDAMKALLRHCLLVVITATGKVDLGLILEIVQTLPQNLNDVEEPEKLRSMQLLAQAEEKATSERKHELEMARRYFLWEWPTLADRTRSSIAITLSVLLDAFLRYPLRDMFLSELTVSPDDVLAGKIVIVDVPVKTFDLIGKIAGVLWKYSIQRAIERRPELINGHSIERIRPIFIAADEAQFWATGMTDTHFQMTARSARGLTVYSTQSIPNFYSEMGGDGTARARVDSLLGNLQTRIACQNLDSSTNQWHSESIGKIIVKRQSRSVTVSNFIEDVLAQYSASGKPVNVSISEQLDFDVQPRAFTGLKRGGIENRGIVEAILTTAGTRFRSNGKRWMRMQFNQFNQPGKWRSFLGSEVVIAASQNRK